MKRDRRPGVTRKARLTAVIAAVIAFPVQAHDIIRHAHPNQPVASSVLVPAGSDTVYVGGTLADVADPSAPQGSVERFGDTRTQAKSILDKIARELQASGFTMDDVVTMTVYLVADPRKNSRVDLEGLVLAYMQVYGIRAEEQALPVRTTVQVAGLTAPGALVQIEAVAARHPAH